jgi:hypothetical protein
MTQSLPRLQQDVAARQSAGRHYEQSMTERYGAVSVARARSEQALSRATAPEAAVTLGAQEGQRGAQAAAPSPASTGQVVRSRPGLQVPTPASAAPSDFSPISRYVQGQTFFFNEDQWIDSRVQANPDAKRQRVQFASDDYFALLANRPETRDWLALGQNVQFLLDNTVYEIHP